MALEFREEEFKKKSYWFSKGFQVCKTITNSIFIQIDVHISGIFVRVLQVNRESVKKEVYVWRFYKFDAINRTAYSANYTCDTPSIKTMFNQPTMILPNRICLINHWLILGFRELSQSTSNNITLNDVRLRMHTWKRAIMMSYVYIIFFYLRSYVKCKMGSKVFETFEKVCD